MPTVYGIKNCDSVKKARKYLEAQGTDYQFHDFRADGLTSDKIDQWLTQTDWQKLLNKRSTTWKQLDEAVKESVGPDNLSDILAQHPTLIKRPVIESEGNLIIGFDAQALDALS